MSFTAICWLIVKICAGIIALFLCLGFIAKFIAKKRNIKTKQDEDDGEFLSTNG